MNMKSMVVLSVSMGSVLAHGIDLPVTAGLNLHLDAYRQDSMTLSANNEVLEWRSLGSDGTVFQAAARMTFPVGPFCTGIPYLVEERGYPAVFFGSTYDGQPTNSLMATTTPVQNQTLFVVNRQQSSISMCALLGQISDSTSRLYRDINYDYCWKTTNFTELWINDVKGKTSFGNIAATAEPHLVSGVRTENRNIECLGAAYVWNPDAGVATNPDWCYAKTSFHEVISYDRLLSDSEIAAVQAYLIAKWGLRGTVSYKVWTGEGATNDWNDPDNWKGNAVPAATATVCLFNASVGATSDCSAARVIAGNSTLTLQDGVRFVVGDAAGLSVDGNGVLVVGGTFDLSGCEQVICGVEGGGVITNSASAQARLVISNDCATTLGARVRGNVAVEKRGAGEMSIVPGQSYSGDTEIVAGSAVAATCLEGYGNLTVHLDASDRDSFTLDSDQSVLEWRSLTPNGQKFLAAATAYPDARFRTGYSFRMSAKSGLPFVRFGYDQHSVFTGSFVKADQKIRNRTLFFVNQQYDYARSQAIFGNTYDYDNRIIRSGDVPFLWKQPAGCTLWVNGEKCADAGSFAETSGGTAPHLLVVQRNEVVENEIIGAAWVQNGAGAGADVMAYDLIYGLFDLYEVVIYDTALTDEQVRQVSAYLMEKWRCPHKETVDLGIANTLSPATAFSLADGTSLDFGGFDQIVKSIGGSGRVLSGGSFSLAETSAASGALSLYLKGELDLQGEELTVSGVTGGGSIVNSGLGTATLAVIGGGNSRLDARLTGDVSLVKRGEGTLSVVAGQTNSGRTELGGGGIAVSDDVHYRSYGRLAVHCDASVEDSFVLEENGNVIRWDSLTDNGLFFKSAAEAYPNAKFRTGYAFRHTTTEGVPCVRFGLDQQNVYTGSFLKASQPISGRTLFFVNRQFYPTVYGCLIGNAYTYEGRIFRDSANSCAWKLADAGDGWINGARSDSLSFDATSFTSYPHLLVVRRNANVTDETVGANWFLYEWPGGDVIDYELLYSRMDLQEMLIYEDALTDEQIAEISAALIRKWNIPTAQGTVLAALDDPLSVLSEFRVSGSGSLDLGGRRQSIPSLSFDVALASETPCLTLTGNCDVTATALSFLNAANVQRGKFLVTTGALTGPFQSVSGVPEGSVRYRANQARLSLSGFVLTIR